MDYRLAEKTESGHPTPWSQKDLDRMEDYSPYFSPLENYGWDEKSPDELFFGGLGFFVRNIFFYEPRK